MPEIVDATDPIGSAVKLAHRPRLTQLQICWMLAGCIRIPSVFAAAQRNLTTQLFEPSETKFILLWRGALATAADHRGAMPSVDSVAKDILVVKCDAEMANDPTGTFYTPTVRQAVMGESGLLDEIYMLAVGPETEVEAFKLLAEFINERASFDPFRRAVMGMGPNQSVSDFGKIVDEVQKQTLNIVGLGRDPGTLAVDEEVEFRPESPNLFTTRVNWMDQMFNGGQAPNECYSILAATGAGKCHGINTPILMFDGSVKMVQDVVVGDLVMGPDSRPRTVLSLGRGREMMYRVTGTDESSYVVNESHILSIKITPRRVGQKHCVLNIPLREYLKANETFKHCAKGYRVGVEFGTKTLPLDAYYLGLWLADGSVDAPTIHKPDPEVLETVTTIAESYGLRVNTTGRNRCPSHHLSRKTRSETNRLRQKMSEMELFNNKHIPHDYLTASRDQRLQLLAGLVDGDGSLSHGGYEYSTVLESLADSVQYLARSLGLACHKKQRTTRCQTGVTCVSYRLFISGDCSVIPCRIPRKMASPRKQIKDATVYGIKIEPIGEGDYYGFTIDGDHLYLLGDFTVTHNTSMGVQLSLEGAMLQASLVDEIGPEEAGHWYYFTYELTRKQLQSRVYQYGAKIHADTLQRNEPYSSSVRNPGGLKAYERDPYVNSDPDQMLGESERVAAFTKRMSGVKNRLHLVDYSGACEGHGNGYIPEIAMYLKRQQSMGRKVTGFVIDYAGLVVERWISSQRKLKPDDAFPLLSSFIDNVRNTIALPLGCTGWILHQLKGAVTKKSAGTKMHHSEAQGCASFANNADFALQWGMYNRVNGLLTATCTKHRRAPGVEDGIIVQFRGEFGAFVSPDKEYAIDPMTGGFVPKEFLDKLDNTTQSRGHVMSGAPIGSRFDPLGDF